MEDNKSLFDKLYGAKKEVLDLLKKPLVKKQIKRKFASALDDCVSKIIDKQRAIQEARENFSKDWDINNILETHEEIDELEKIKALVKKEYKELFDEEMKD